MIDLFADAVTLQEQISEVDRELSQRAAVYPRLVSTGKLKQARADRQVRALQAVRDTLERLHREATS